MYYISLIIILFFYSCNNKEVEDSKSIHSYIDNEIKGEPVSIEIYNEKIESLIFRDIFLRI